MGFLCQWTICVIPKNTGIHGMVMGTDIQRSDWLYLKIIRLIDTFSKGNQWFLGTPLFKKHSIGFVEILCNFQPRDTGKGSNFGLVGYFEWVLTTKNVDLLQFTAM